MKDDIKRFWARVDMSGGPDACWPWITANKVYRYGRAWFCGRLHGAHRLAWELERGAIPGGLFVLHACDRSLCCNPSHLFLGSQADNLRDMMAKGRARPPKGDRHGSRTHPDRVARGERIGTSKLTAPDVLAIRAWSKSGFTQSQIASAYGISSSTVCEIANRILWAHI